MSNFQPGFQDAGRAAEVVQVPLDVQLNVQEELIQSLARAIGTLETRLSPVLSPLSLEVGKATQLPEAKCSLGSIAAKNNTIIVELMAILHSITARVDITAP